MINQILANKIIEQQLMRQPSALKNMRVTALRQVETEINIIKKEMLYEFENHPVTREIEMGPNGQNISGTLGGKGNLFTFIGFNRNDKPTLPIKEYLLQVSVAYKRMEKGRFIFDITYPSKEELFSITPMPWASGRSWLKGIELGMSGLGMYLHKEGDPIRVSRSGQAIQIKGKINPGKFTNTSYISKIINNFTAKIERL